MRRSSSKTSMSFLKRAPSKISKFTYCHNDNIVTAASNIFRKFQDEEEVICCAEMQSGKTDVMKRVIYVINTFPKLLSGIGITILSSRIYLILCISSINLKKQLKTKLPEISNNVFHLDDVQKFIKDPYENRKLLTNMADRSLIMFDECHCDCEIRQTVFKFRRILEINAKGNRTNYYKLGVSATPYEQVTKKYPKVIMYPDVNYYGLINMFESKPPRVFQAKELDNLRECKKLFNEIKIGDFYYIVRLSGKKQISETMMKNIETVFRNKKHRIDTYIYDMNHRQNINEILDEEPEKPTVIYLKGKLRAGEYLNTEHVCMVHDCPHNKNTNTTVQSLIGRCCGYHKKKHNVKIYCDYEKAHQHYEWIKSNYKISKIPEDTKYIYSTGEVNPKCMY